MQKKINKIAVVTGTRAEYGLLKPLIKEIKEDKRIENNLVSAGNVFRTALYSRGVSIFHYRTDFGRGEGAHGRVSRQF